MQCPALHSMRFTNASLQFWSLLVQPSVCHGCTAVAHDRLLREALARTHRHNGMRGAAGAGHIHAARCHPQQTSQKRAEPLAGLPGATPSSPSVTQTAVLDKMDARASGAFVRLKFEPPYTREKYLQYFRPMHYGEASLERHGGNRHVDVEMAQELLQVYKKQRSPPAGGARGEAGSLSIGEDDVRFSHCPRTWSAAVSQHAQRFKAHAAL